MSTLQLRESQEDLDAVPIHDNGEPLVDILELSPRLYFTSEHPVFEFPRVPMVRRSVADMLKQAALSLPPGLSLRVVEGYRPMEVQRAQFQFNLERVRTAYPDWDESQVLHEAERFSAPPDAKCPPPHLTGGAVDLDIIDENGELLDFMSPYELLDMEHAAPDAPGLTDVARSNRALLRSVLEPTGLTNYVAEWWHWSYGDSGWALRVGAKYALYDAATLPADARWIGDMDKLPRN